MTKHMRLYEKAFDLNDYVVLGLIVIGYALIWLLPKRFSRSVTCLILLFCATVSCMLDDSIGGHIIDWYDIMDGPKFTIMDAVVYAMYPPLGYFFVYGYDRWQIRGLRTLFYISGCSLLAVLVEWCLVSAGVFHYKNGYFIYYSFSVYILTQSLTVSFYRFITK